MTETKQTQCPAGRSGLGDRSSSTSTAFTVGMLTAAFGLAVATIAGGNGGVGFVSGFLSGFLLSAGLLTYPELHLARGKDADAYRNTTVARCPACGARLSDDAKAEHQELLRKPMASADMVKAEWKQKSS